MEHGKQVYIFIENAVFNEYQTYLKNKDNESIKYAAVDDRRIYKFIEEIDSLPLNNAMQPFSGANDIMAFLKEQWAGLFQRLLESNMRQKETNTIENLNNIAATLQQLATYLQQKSDNKDIAIKEILFSSHPALIQLRQACNIPVKIILGSFAEINKCLNWLGFKQKTKFVLGKDIPVLWEHKSEEQETHLLISSGIFDEKGNLKLYQPEDWNSEWITKTVKELCFDDDTILEKISLSSFYLFQKLSLKYN